MMKSFLLGVIIGVVGLAVYKVAKADEIADKLKHFGVSAVAGMASASIIGKDHPYQAFAIAIIPGVIKEAIDSKRGDGSGWSNRDLAADALGAISGVLLTNWIVSPKGVWYHVNF